MPVRILIADDSPVVRTTLRHLLASPTREIVEAENGEEAVAKTHELRPDLVVLDLAMPVLDGLNAARKISQLQPQTRIVMYTMHWAPHLELEAQKYGVRSVVSKSDSQALLAAVDQQLRAPLDPTPESPPPLSPFLIPTDPAPSLTPAEPAAVPPPAETKSTPDAPSALPQASVDPENQ